MVSMSSTILIKDASTLVLSLDNNRSSNRYTIASLTQSVSSWHVLNWFTSIWGVMLLSPGKYLFHSRLLFVTVGLCTDHRQSNPVMKENSTRPNFTSIPLIENTNSSPLGWSYLNIRWWTTCGAHAIFSHSNSRKCLNCVPLNMAFCFVVSVVWISWITLFLPYLFNQAQKYLFGACKHVLFELVSSTTYIFSKT